MGSASVPTPSQLQAHRARIEHDVWHNRPLHVKAIREAAKAYDELLAREAIARKGGRQKNLKPVNVRRKVA